MIKIYTQINSLRSIPKFLVSIDDLKPENLNDIILAHAQFIPRYELLEQYYLGQHRILDREMSTEDKPNNKIISDYPQMVVDTKTGYFLGNPVVYKSDNPEYLEKYNGVMKNNNSADQDAEQSKTSGIYGHSFELHYTDEDKESKFMLVNPKNIIMIYNTSIEQELIGAIRYYTYQKIVNNTVEQYYHAELYTDTEITIFESRYDTQNVEQSIKDVIPHYYGEVPIVEFYSNEERQSEYETLLTMIDAYELALADSVNEINYMNDAYLMLKNYTATDAEEITDMKNNRIILIDEDGDAQWLVKDINDTHYVNIQERLDRDIHKFANVPNMADESFGEASGTALRYRLYGLETDTSMKERKFTTSLGKRAELITNYYNFKENSSYDYNDLYPVYTRNIPVNEFEAAQIAQTLTGLVSQETLLSQLPHVENVKMEIEQLKQEKEENMAYYDYNFKDEEEEDVDNE